MVRFMKSNSMGYHSGYRGKARGTGMNTNHSNSWFRDLIRFCDNVGSDQLTLTVNITELNMLIEPDEFSTKFISSKTQRGT